MGSGPWVQRAITGWLVTVASLGVWRSHLSLAGLDAWRPQAQTAVSLSPVTRRLWSGTYRAIVADAYYLRAVNLYGSKTEHRRGYPGLPSWLWAASCLDPLFVAPYLLAGTALMSVPAHRETATELLARGHAHRSDVWLVSFLYAFDLFERGQWALAAEAMAVAAQGHHAPLFVASLAARLAADSDEPELGLQMLEVVLRATPTDSAQALLRARRDALVYQHQLSLWQRLADEASRDGSTLPSVQVLWQRLAPKEQDALPQHDPWGAPYRWKNGRVTSDNAWQQLHIHHERH